jgi:hypothetical protein
MNRSSILSRFLVIALLFLGFAAPLFAQTMEGLQMAELTRKLQLTGQQQKQLAPIVEQRDKEAQALKTNTSLSRMQKFRKIGEIQTNFRNQAAKILNPEQVKKLDALQAERRGKLTGH